MKRRSSNSIIKHSIRKKINRNWRSFFFQITEFLSSTSPIIKFRILIHHQIRFIIKNLQNSTSIIKLLNCKNYLAEFLNRIIHFIRKMEEEEEEETKRALDPNLRP